MPGTHRYQPVSAAQVEEYMATIELVLMDCHSAVGFVQFHGDLVWVTGTSSEYTFLVFGFLAEL